MENNNRGQLEYPADEVSKRTIAEAFDSFSLDKIMDLVWNKFFYIFDWLGSITVAEPQANDSAGNTEANITVRGTWNAASTGTGSIAFNSGNNVILKTGGTSGATTRIFRSPVNQGILSWGRSQRFRTSFSINSITNSTGYLVRGSFTNGVYFGFKISAASLMGVTNDGVNPEVTTTIATISSGVNYDLEARLYPNNKMVFYIRNSTTNIFEVKGNLNSNFPLGTGTLNLETDLAQFYIKNSANEDKQLTLTYFEFIQSRL